MPKTVDMELKKAFAELQQKMHETTQKLKIADAQIETLKRSMHHAQLTGREISNLPADTKTYASVGRMFLLTDVSEVCENLQRKSYVCSERIRLLETNKAYLERNLKDSENNLREMVQQKKDTSHTTA